MILFRMLLECCILHADCKLVSKAAVVHYTVMQDKSINNPIVVVCMTAQTRGGSRLVEYGDLGEGTLQVFSRNPYMYILDPANPIV